MLLQAESLKPKVESQKNSPIRMKGCRKSYYQLKMQYLQLLLTAFTIFPLVSASPLPDESDIKLTDAEIAAIGDAHARTFGNTTGPICGCGLLSFFMNDKTYFAGSSPYTVESTKNWNVQAWKDPKCVFVPVNAKEVAKGVQIMKTCQAGFAIRGGGHMPVPGAANIQDGVLFSMSGLRTLQLSADKSTLDVGPAYNWGQVYEFLQPYELYVIGGRLSIVGVPGLLLGGGLNFLSNKYGFAMDNVVAYEVVLASGAVVTATATNSHKDLFWALKGGANNFGIVTKFTLKTLHLPQVWSGIGTFTGDANFDKFYSGITNFANSGYKEKGAGIIPQINWQRTPGAPGGGLSIGLHMLMHEGKEENPPIFNDFESIQFLQSEFAITTPRNISDMLSYGISPPRHVFRAQTSLATLEAAKIVHETFYGLTTKLATDVPSVTIAGVAIQPISKTIVAVGEGKTPFSGIDPTQNYFWYTINVHWSDPADDAKVNAWISEAGDTMHAKFEAVGLVGNNGREFLYLNDANGGQDIFAGYGQEVVKRLKRVREKYDKGGKVFGRTGLCKGGFKL